MFAVVGCATYLATSGEEKHKNLSSADELRASGRPESDLVLGAGQTVSPSGPAAPAPKAESGSAARMTSLLVPKAPVEGVPLVAAGMNPDADKGRVLRLNPASFKSWGAVAPGERILLPTAGGEELYGTVNLVSSDPGWFRMGGTLDGEKGTFQLNAGAEGIHGGIYLLGLGIGYQIQMDGSDVVLVERRLSALMCHPGARLDPAGIEADSSGKVANVAGTQVIPALNTRPGAAGVIYMDFAGGVIKSTLWAESLTTQPSALSGDSITQVINRVAECFAPFDMTVTTNLSVYQGTPVGRRMRVVVTPTDTVAPGKGGVAYIGSWRWGGSDMVCWVFTKTVKKVADAATHEVGHTLGLWHHGTKIGKLDYYRGHGGGVGVPTSWAPIMGSGYDVNLTHWSRGQYYDANNTDQDDLYIIGSGTYNFTKTVTPGSNGLVRVLPLSGTVFQTSGTLTSQEDSNVFQFSTTGGRLTASVRPVSAVSMGDFRLDLVDGNGASMSVADPVDTLGASLSQTLVRGVYRLKVVPTGTGPQPPAGYTTGYSAYSALGGYSLTGMVEGANNLPAFLSPSLILATVGVPISVKFEVTDAGNTTVTPLVQKLPAWAKFDSKNLVLSGTPTMDTSTGSWSLTLLAKSGAGETRMDFNLVVSPESLSLTDPLGSAVREITTLPMAPWIGVSRTRADGAPGTVAQSAPVADKGTSLLRCNYTAPAPAEVGQAASSWSIMTFFWQSDTEPGKDIVQCKVDGVVAKDMLTGQPVVLSGKRDWVKQTVLLSGAGTRRIEFVYTKDANLKAGADKVWVYGINIGQPPQIKTSPVSALRVTPGTAVGSGSFSLSAAATGAVSVAWWRNGVALAEGTSASGSTLSGVRTGTLTVSNAKAADAGVYWLVARNSWGAVASKRSEVVVWVPPVVTSQPVAPIGLRIGDPLILTAQVSGAQPMYYQWKKDGVPGRWSTKPSLTLNRTTATSAGKYVLVAVNPSGTVSSQEVTVSLSQTSGKTASVAK